MVFVRDSDALAQCSTARAFLVGLVDVSDGLSHFLLFFLVVGQIASFKLRIAFAKVSTMHDSVAAAK